MTAADATSPSRVAGTGSPSLGPVFAAEYRLLLRSVATRGRLAAIGALALLSVLSSVAVAALSSSSDGVRAGLNFADGNVATLLPIAVLVFGAGVIGDLIDDGSLVYLWLRPVPSWLHVLAAWAATITITVPLVLAPMVLSAAIIDPSAELIGATALGGLVGIVTYAGIFVMLGIRFRRALPWGLVYVLIWEGFIASAGKTATKLAIRSYVRSIMGTLTDTQLKLGEFSLGIGLLVPLLVGALALVYASRRLAKTDVA